MVYLKIGGTVCEAALLPDMIEPSVQLIKNEERSISGMMNVDIVARKTKLAVSWSYLGADDMNIIASMAEQTYPYEVEYMSPKTNADGSQSRKMNAYVSDFTYSPFFIGDKLSYKNIKLELTEM